MHAGIKVVVGLIFVILGLFLFMDSVYPMIQAWLPIDWLGNFMVVLTGAIPFFLIIVGLFVVWLEVDELKAQKELNKEEETEKKEPEHKEKGEEKK